jgi:hypothetical protein
MRITADDRRVAVADRDPGGQCFGGKDQQRTLPHIELHGADLHATISAAPAVAIADNAAMIEDQVVAAITVQIAFDQAAGPEGAARVAGRRDLLRGQIARGIAVLCCGRTRQKGTEAQTKT